MAVAGDVIRIVLYFDCGSEISRASAMAAEILRASPIETPRVSISSMVSLEISARDSGRRLAFFVPQIVASCLDRRMVGPLNWSDRKNLRRRQSAPQANAVALFPVLRFGQVQQAFDFRQICGRQ